MPTVARKYTHLQWELAVTIACSLRNAGVDLATAEHVQLWRPELVQYADVWSTREHAVRHGEAKVRLACPSFLYMYYASPGLKSELMNRGRTRKETVCTRTRKQNGL